MQSFIIASNSDIKTQSYIDDLRKKESVSIFDTTIITPESSIGIKDVRELQSTIFLKPLQSPKKLIVLKNAASATLDAQNSLLKLLEEPPPHVIIALVVENPDSLLSTIRSRCTLVSIEEKIDENKDFSELKRLILSLPNMKVGEKLKIAQDVGKTKEETQQWIKEMIQAGREILLEEISKGNVSISFYLNLLTALNKAYFSVSTTNISPRFILEDMLIG